LRRHCYAVSTHQDELVLEPPLKKILDPPMPIAPLLADVIMNYVIDQALTKINVQNKPIVLWRYVDDIFVAFNDMTFSLMPSTV